VNTIRGVGFDFFVELRPLTFLIEDMDLVFVSETVFFTISNWFADQGLYLDDLVQSSISAHVNTHNESGYTHSTVNYFLCVYRFYRISGISISMIDTILAIHHTTITVNIDTDSTIALMARLSHWLESPLSPRDTLTNQTLDPILTSDNGKPVLTDTFEKLTLFNLCAFVAITIQKTEIVIKEKTIDLLTYNYTVSLDDVFIVDNLLYMCVDTANQVFGSSHQGVNISSPNPENTSTNDVAILSLVCLILSILFGLATLLTYVLFKPLRTQPGVNNMLLAAYLVVSQVLFLFGFNQSSSTSASVCTVLGVLIHYTWLLLLVWMNTCTLHMVRVFLYHNTTVAKFNVLKTTAIYTLYCALVALVPVLINIIISTVNSSDNNIGYGGSFCYITGNDFHIYILSIPLAILILANIVLYVVVIVHIERTRLKRQPSTSTSDNRSLISAYMKMSTITGMTWIFGFVFMFTEQRWAEYMFVLLNATQGVFIFIAFIANKRVLGLYKELIKRMRKNVKIKSNTMPLSTSKQVDNSKSIVTSYTTETSTPTSDTEHCNI